MARRKREDVIEHPEEPDLAPFMNLVIILIPMLLLSVVFLEVAVINVTMPIGGAATQDEDADEDDEKELDLTVTVAMNGFYVSAWGDVQEPIEGCGPSGPTICLVDGVSRTDVEAAFEDARRISLDDEEAGEERLAEGLESYRWRELYNMMADFKQQVPDPEEETTFKLAADDDAPFALTVRVMDVARYQLEENEYDDDEAFWTAEPQFEEETGDDGETIRSPVSLFGDPAFTVAQ